MDEKEIKYMGMKIKYKMVEIPERLDEYRRPLTIKVAKRSDAKKYTDDETGAMYWSCNSFVDWQIDAYIDDKEYEELTDASLIEMAERLKLYTK